MCGILGSIDGGSDDGGTSDWISAPLVEEINLVDAICPNLILESDFIRAAVAEIGEELKKNDIPVRNHSRCWRRKEEGTNGEGFEHRGGHRDDSSVDRQRKRSSNGKCKKFIVAVVTAVEMKEQT